MPMCGKLFGGSVIDGQCCAQNRCYWNWNWWHASLCKWLVAALMCKVILQIIAFLLLFAQCMVFVNLSVQETFGHDAGVVSEGIRDANHTSASWNVGGNWKRSFLRPISMVSSYWQVCKILCAFQMYFVGTFFSMSMLSFSIKKFKM